MSSKKLQKSKHELKNIFLRIQHLYPLSDKWNAVPKPIIPPPTTTTDLFFLFSDIFWQLLFTRLTVKVLYEVCCKCNYQEEDYWKVDDFHLDCGRICNIFCCCCSNFSIVIPSWKHDVDFVRDRRNVFRFYKIEDEKKLKIFYIYHGYFLFNEFLHWCHILFDKC